MSITKTHKAEFAKSTRMHKATHTNMATLITGGAGYIGSHAALEHLNRSDEQLIVVDSLENGYQESLTRVQELAGKQLIFIEGDIREEGTLNKIFDHKIETIMHFAAYKSVGEAETNPDKYQDNNVGGVEKLLSHASNTNLKKFIFSSTAAIYGFADSLPINELAESKPIGVYGKTKLEAEQVIAKHAEQKGFKAISLRYFNVIGCHSSGQIGEDPGKPENLIPRVMKHLMTGSQLQLFGNKFDTKDGSQERDYIDVEDLVSAHVDAMNYDPQNSFEIINLSTGTPTSCLEIFDMIEDVTGKTVDYKLVGPRQGDPEVLYASNDKAKELLNWEPKYTVKQAIEKQWNWTTQNPDGYSSK